jgi:DNA polymerase-3 subunit epsilon
MLPQTLLIVDLETTGTDPKKDQVIELGAILYSVTHCCSLQQLSTLFPVLENQAESINHISCEASQEIKNFQMALSQFCCWVEQADYLVAHYAQFDKEWFGNGVLPEVNKPWLCTFHDFIWPKNHRPTNLVSTALNHGVGVSHAHRALTDCQLIAAIFDRVGADPQAFRTALEKAIQGSKDPLILVVANVPIERKDLAKQHGFKWNKYLEKKWVKEIKRSEFLIEKDQYPFDYDVDTF